MASGYWPVDLQLRRHRFNPTRQESGKASRSNLYAAPWATIFSSPARRGGRQLGRWSADITLDVYADPFDTDLDAVAQACDEA